MPLSIFTATKDSYLDSGRPNDNYGLVSPLFIGVSSSSFFRSILEWDMSRTDQAIPEKAVVIDAFVRQNRVDISVIPPSIRFTAHTVIGSWVERDVTWNHRSRVVSWSSNGGDFNAQEYGTRDFPASAGLFDLGSKFVLLPPPAIPLKSAVENAIANQNGIISLIFKRTVESSPSVNISTESINGLGGAPPKLHVSWYIPSIGRASFERASSFRPSFDRPGSRMWR